MKLGGFNVLRRIAAGSSSRVYLADACGAGGFRRSVALRIPSQEICDDPGRLEQFVADARLAAHFGHPSVLGTREMGQFRGVLFTVMDLASGPSLADLAVHARDPMPAEVAIYVGVQLCNAVQSVFDTARAKALTSVTCEIRPDHVFVDHGGIVRLAGLAVARPVDIDGYDDERRVYTPPEVRRGRVPTQRSVQYMLGITLWELLAERSLIGAMTRSELDALLSDGLVPRLDEINPRVPEAVADVVHRAVAADPAARFGKPNALAAALLDAAAPLGLDIGTAEATVDYLVQDGVLERFAADRDAYAQRFPITGDEVRGHKSPVLSKPRHSVPPGPDFPLDDTLHPEVRSSRPPEAPRPRRLLGDAALFMSVAATSYFLFSHGMRDVSEPATAPPAEATAMPDLADDPSIEQVAQVPEVPSATPPTDPEPPGDDPTASQPSQPSTLVPAPAPERGHRVFPTPN